MTTTPAAPTPPSAPAATIWEPWFIPLPKSALDDPWWRLMVAWLAAVSGH